MLIADQLELDFFHEPEPAAVEVIQRPKPIGKNGIYEWLIRHPFSGDYAVPEYDKVLRQGFSDYEVFDQIDKSKLIRDPEIFVERQKRLHGGVDEKVVQKYAELYVKDVLFEELRRIKGGKYNFPVLKVLANDALQSSDELYKLEKARDEELFNTESFKFLKALFSRPEATGEEQSVLTALSANCGVLNYLIGHDPSLSDFPDKYAQLEIMRTLGRKPDKTGEDLLERSKSLALANEIMDWIYTYREDLQDIIVVSKPEPVLNEQFRERLKELSKRADETIKTYLDRKEKQETENAIGTDNVNPEKEILEWLSVREKTFADFRLREGYSRPGMVQSLPEHLKHPNQYIKEFKDSERYRLVDKELVEKIATYSLQNSLLVHLREQVRDKEGPTSDYVYDITVEHQNLAEKSRKLHDEIYRAGKERDRRLFETDAYKFIRGIFRDSKDKTEVEDKILEAVGRSGVYANLIRIDPSTYQKPTEKYRQLVEERTAKWQKDIESYERLQGNTAREYYYRAAGLAFLRQIVRDFNRDPDYFNVNFRSDAWKPWDLKTLTERIEKLTKEADEAFIKYMEPNEYNRDGTRKLEDFGEDLNNTRKGRGAGQSKEKYPAINFVNLTDWQIENYLSLQPLEKVWPMQSIHDLYRTNPEGAAFLYLLRSEIGKKPRTTTRQYQRYVEKALTAIRIHQQLLNQSVNEEVRRDFFDGFYGAARHYKLWSLVEPKFWNNLDVYSVLDAKEFCKRNDYSLSDGSDINTYTYSLVVPCKQGQHDGCLRLVDKQRNQTSSSYVAIVSNDLDDLKNKLNNHLQRFIEQNKNVEAGGEKVTKPLAPVSLFGRYQRGDYEVYGKVGTIELQLTDRLTFENDKAFTQYVKDHQQELSAKYHELRAEYSKTEKDWRGNSPIRDRIGPDWRKGKDATPEMFMQAFGFRGVEFGNWVHQGKNGRERQWMINNAYDSLCDLASILNIPTKAVALDGSLGLCFGSRGFGSASAHYEPENRIINLTKTKGYSSLAHEWFHALDHYMARNLYEHKLKGKYFMSERAEPVNYGLTKEAAERIRKEIGQEFKHVNIETLDTESVIRRVDSQLKEGTELKQLLDGSLRELSFGIVCTPLDNTGYRTVVRKEVRLTKDDISQKELTPARYEFTEEAKKRFIQYINETGVKVSNPESPIQLMLSEVVRGSNFNDLLAGRIDKISINSDDFYFFTKDGKKLQFELKKEDFLPVMVRPEVFYAWGDTIEAIRGSSMHQRMTKKNAYWQSKIEEAARSFEAFVEVKCKELGIQNDFLTRDVHLDKELGKESFYPYLNGKDVATVTEKFDKLFKEIRTRETSKGVELFSKIKGEKGGATVSEIQDSLNKYFGKKTINSLVDSGQLGIVGTVEEAIALEVLSDIKESKINKKTGNVVPDELAHGKNPEGIIALVQLKKYKDFPAGNIVVKVGYHIPGQNRGYGAKHLTGNLIEHPSRDISEGIENKTEAALVSLKKVLESSTELFRETDRTYVFYSPKYRRAVPCRLNDSESEFTVLTDRPINIASDRYKLWGKDSVRLSGALIFPDPVASVTTASLIPAIEQQLDGTQPVTSHKDLYTDVNYTEEIRIRIEKFGIKKSEDSQIQGFYSSKQNKSFLIAKNLTAEAAPAVLLHEIGVHMAHDSLLAKKMDGLIEAAPDIYQLGLKGNDPVALAVYKRLNDSGVNERQPAYKEEVCGYLVEESAKQDAKLWVVKRWTAQVLSAAKVWLYEHNFDIGKLTARDLATIAKSNVKTLAAQKREAEKTSEVEKVRLLSEEGKRVLSTHIKGMQGRYKTIKEAEPEIKRLYEQFCEFEKAGIPLPTVTDLSAKPRRDTDLSKKGQDR